MKMPKTVMAPAKGRQIKKKTEYPPSETVQNETLSVSQMFERYNQDPEKSDKNYFDPSESEYLRGFLKPNLDLTDLENLKSFQKNLKKRITDAEKRKEEMAALQAKKEKGEAIEPPPDPKEGEEE